MTDIIRTKEQEKKYKERKKILIMRKKPYKWKYYDNKPLTYTKKLNGK